MRLRVAAFEVEEDQARGVRPARVKEVHLLAAAVKPTGALESASSCPRRDCAPVRVLGVPEEHSKPPSGVAAIAPRTTKWTSAIQPTTTPGFSGCGSRLPVERAAGRRVELLVLPVQRDEQRVGEVGLSVHYLGLNIVEGRQVTVLCSRRIHGVDPPVLVAALVLEVDDVAVVLGPEKHPEPRLRSSVTGSKSSRVPPDGADPYVQDAALGSEVGQAFSVGGEAWSLRSGLPKRTSRGIKGTVVVWVMCSSLRSSQHFSTLRASRSACQHASGLRPSLVSTAPSASPLAPCQRFGLSALRSLARVDRFVR